MPIHDWTRVEAGDFHDFHQCWVIAIRNALNAGLLPPGYMAMAEQVTGRPIPDVVTLQAREPNEGPEGGIALALAPPTARVIARMERINYAKRADRVVIRHGRGKVVAIIEIVSPGNKDNTNGLKAFVRKAGKLLRRGVHLLVVDLFPPSVRDPHGIHKAIWDQFKEEPFELPPDKPLTLAAYAAGSEKVAYVENVAVGDRLPDMPIFLTPDHYVPCPLEASYQVTWGVFPGALKGRLELPPK
jgi:hypothetical protein